MLANVAASAAAARAIGYPGLADLIEVDGLGPEQVAALLRLTCCKRAARDYAVIILAARIGLYRACPKGWSAEPERTLALEILAGDETAFTKLSDQASKIVNAHWREITAPA